MKVMLLQDLKPLGVKGEIVDVNDGYAKNYIIPKKIGSEATKAVVNEYNQRLEKEKRQKEKEKQDAIEMKHVLATKTVEVGVRCGDGKMYGSVTTQDIADALAAQGITVDKKKITIDEPIRALGEYDVTVWLYKETTVKVHINVVKA